jgi:hypothetical protein
MAFRFEDGCRPNYNPAWPTVSNVKRRYYGRGPHITINLETHGRASQFRTAVRLDYAPS